MSDKKRRKKKKKKTSWKHRKYTFLWMLKKISKTYCTKGCCVFRGAPLNAFEHIETFFINFSLRSHLPVLLISCSSQLIMSLKPCTSQQATKVWVRISVPRDFEHAVQLNQVLMPFSIGHNNWHFRKKKLWRDNTLLFWNEINCTEVFFSKVMVRRYTFL